MICPQEYVLVDVPTSEIPESPTPSLTSPIDACMLKHDSSQAC